MGYVETIRHDKFPEQGSCLGKMVEVSFHFKTTWDLNYPYYTPKLQKTQCFYDYCRNIFKRAKKPMRNQLIPHRLLSDC